jgi:hypothetical protein
MGKKKAKTAAISKDARVVAAEKEWDALSIDRRGERRYTCLQNGHQIITTNDHRVFCVHCARYLTDPGM